MHALICSSVTIYLIAGFLVCMARSVVYSRGEVSVHMRKHQRIWLYFQQHRAASIVAGHISVVAILGLLLLGNTDGHAYFGSFCPIPLLQRRSELQCEEWGYAGCDSGPL